MLISENGIIHYDGIKLENPFKSGYTTGYGLFETLYVNKGEPLFLEEHYKRMKRSIHLMKLPAMPEYNIVVKWCNNYICALIKENCVSEFSGKLRINWVKSDGQSADLHIYGEAFSYPINWYKKGIRSGFSKDICYSGSKLDKIKTLSYAENIIGKSNAMEDGYQEAIRINRADEICEGTFSNVFWTSGNALYTPTIETGALPGIVRQWVIKTAIENEIEVVEKAFGKSVLNKVDSIFFTNSLMGIMPVSVFEHREIKTLDDNIYKLLSRKYKNLLGI